MKDERIHELEQYQVKKAQDKEKMEEKALKEAQNQEKILNKVRKEVLELRGQGLEYVRVITELKKSIYEDKRAVERKKGFVHDRGVQVMPTVNSFAVQTDQFNPTELGSIIQTGESNSSNLSCLDLEQHQQRNKEQIRYALNDDSLTVGDAKQLL